MCPAVLSGIFLWPSEPAADRGEPEVLEVLERGENGWEMHTCHSY